jgi:hypothetical protein
MVMQNRGTWRFGTPAEAQASSQAKGRLKACATACRQLGGHLHHRRHRFGMFKQLADSLRHNQYATDPAAQVDTPDITFQWLDYVLRGGKKPQLLEDKINYEVMGADVWRHSPTLEAMHNEALTLYLTTRKDGKYYRLAGQKPASPAFLEQTVDFADRKSESNRAVACWWF